VGADGAGKSTVTRMVERSIPVPATTVYMGVSLESSTTMLPTTRLLLAFKRMRGRRPVLTASAADPVRSGRSAGSLPKRALRSLKAAGRLVVWLGEEWYREAVAAVHLRRGEVVLFDRHFLPDYYAHDVVSPRPRSVSQRIHGFFLLRVYPRPDLTICLDAPAEVLAARKPGATVDFLERRRREYLELDGVVPRLEVVDATQPLQKVASDVADIIVGFHRTRTNGRTRR
jgi:thymidylate kinase